jgi:hypothetical protein
MRGADETTREGGNKGNDEKTGSTEMSRSDTAMIDGEHATILAPLNVGIF